MFWERLELQDFPVDTQELTVTLTTKRSPDELRIMSNPSKLSLIDLNANNTFMEQQKWYVYFKKVKAKIIKKKIRFNL